MKKATLQTDQTWKIEEFTSEETEQYNKEVAENLGRIFSFPLINRCIQDSNHSQTNL